MKKRSGLALAEALIAIATLATGAVITSTIIHNAIFATTISKDFLVAQNLVTEGIEVVKNIRDTNWMLRPNDREDCWLIIDPAPIRGNSIDCNTQPSVLPNWNYIADFTYNSWKLVSASLVSSDLDLQNNAPSVAVRYRLYEQDLSAVGASLKYSNIPSVGSVASKFYRSIKAINKFNDMATFEVKVQWKGNGKVYTISRKFDLYNYL